MTRRRDRPVDIKVRPSGSEVLSVRLPSAVLDRLEDAATAAGVTISEYARRLLSDSLEPGQGRCNVQIHPLTENSTATTWLVRV